MRCLLLMALLAAHGEPLAPSSATAEPAVIEGVTPGPRPPREVVTVLTQEISSGLRCPVCQGLSVADSDADTARMMVSRVEELVAAGYTPDQVREYFIGRYGEWVLLEPRANGLNLVLWLGPGIVGGLLLAWAISQLAEWRREGASSGDDPPPSDPLEKELLGDSKR